MSCRLSLLAHSWALTLTLYGAELTGQEAAIIAAKTKPLTIVTCRWRTKPNLIFRFVLRYQVSEKNHQHCDHWDLAVCWPVGSVSPPGLGQLRAGAIRTRLLYRLDRLRGVAQPLHLHHDSVCTLHIPPLSGHPVHLFWHRLEVAQGLPVHPEQWLSRW